MSRISFSFIACKLLMIIVTASTIACNEQTSKGAGETNSKDTNAGTGTNQSAADSINTTPAQSVTVDSATGQFLREAAEGGLAEVTAGKVALGKGTDEGVRRFAQMMIDDHTGIIAAIKNLAESRAINLPGGPSPGHKQNLAELEKKGKKSFDKAYMIMMIEDHKKTIALFETTSGKTPDNEVKDFINQTLPKLKVHLDSATVILPELTQ